MRFISASASPRRKKILKELHFDFLSIPADILELTEDIFPPRLPLLNAILKAAHVARNNPDDLIMGADTVIEFEEQIIGKPANLDQAAEYLRRFSGKTHHVISGISLICRSRGIRIAFCEDTAVTFHTLSDATIADYLNNVEVLDKAGAYSIQEHGDRLVEKISGPMDNVIGLPGKKLLEAVYACGLASLILKQAPSL